MGSAEEHEGKGEMKEETTTAEGGYARSEEVISRKDDQRGQAISVQNTCQLNDEFFLFMFSTSN
jgi:hypothetical protein